MLGLAAVLYGIYAARKGRTPPGEPGALAEQRHCCWAAEIALLCLCQQLPPSACAASTAPACADLVLHPCSPPKPVWRQSPLPLASVTVQGSVLPAVLWRGSAVTLADAEGSSSAAAATASRFGNGATPAGGRLPADQHAGTSAAARQAEAPARVRTQGTLK